MHEPAAVEELDAGFQARHPPANDWRRPMITRRATLGGLGAGGLCVIVRDPPSKSAPSAGLEVYEPPC